MAAGTCPEASDLHPFYYQESSGLGSFRIPTGSAVVTQGKYWPDPILCQLGFNFDGAARLLTVAGLSSRTAVVHLNLRAGSTFPVLVCTVSPGLWVNKADTQKD